MDSSLTKDGNPSSRPSTRYTSSHLQNQGSDHLRHSPLIGGSVGEEVALPEATRASQTGEGNPDTELPVKAYARGNSKRAGQARDIIENPTEIYAVGQGCSRCIKRQEECVWSEILNRCAFCIAHGFPEVTCGRTALPRNFERKMEEKLGLRARPGENKPWPSGSISSEALATPRQPDLNSPTIAQGQGQFRPPSASATARLPPSVPPKGPDQGTSSCQLNSTTTFTPPTGAESKALATARAILGSELVGAPTVAQLIVSAPDTGEFQWRVIRDVLEEDSRNRVDWGGLMGGLERRVGSGCRDSNQQQNTAKQSQLEQASDQERGRSGGSISHSHPPGENVIEMETAPASSMKSQKRASRPYESPQKSTPKPSKRPPINSSSQGLRSSPHNHNFFAHLPRKDKGSGTPKTSQNEALGKVATSSVAQESHEAQELVTCQTKKFDAQEGTADREDTAPTKKRQKNLYQVMSGVQIEEKIAKLTSERDKALAKAEQAQEERDRAFIARDRALEDQHALAMERDRAIAQKNELLQNRTIPEPLKQVLGSFKEYLIDLDSSSAQALGSEDANLAAIHGDVESENGQQLRQVEQASGTRRRQQQSLSIPRLTTRIHHASGVSNGCMGKVVGVQAGIDTDSDDEDTFLNYRAKRMKSVGPRQIE